ncbi:SIS domain-containing protein [Streptosporangium sp. NBC_01469]|nr:SIS domain-containing protein [Streptosporangium sp. NBC_01469]
MAAFARRDHAGRALAGDVERIAAAARAMAARFHLGGKLIVFGDAGADAAHVAVEFMHPVIVGKRALPAVALSNDATTAGGVNDEDGGGDGGGGDEVFAHRVRHWADAADTALGISRDVRCPSVLRGLETAGELGLLTIALTGAGGHGAGSGEVVGPLPAGHTTTEHTLPKRATAGHTLTGRLPADHVLVAASDDPAVVKEVHVTAYHLLWELVHVFLDRLGPPAWGAGR